MYVLTAITGLKTKLIKSHRILTAKIVLVLLSLFSIAPCKAVACNLICLNFGTSSFLLFLIALYKVIALPTIIIAIVVALYRFLRGYRKDYCYFTLSP